MAGLASIQGADNKRNQFNFQDSDHGEKEVEGKLSLELFVPRQMVGIGYKALSEIKLSYRGLKHYPILLASCIFSYLFSVDIALSWVPSQLLSVLLGVLIYTNIPI